MKNIFLVLAAVALLAPSTAFADVQNVHVEEGATLRAGGTYTLVWKESFADAEDLAVYLVGGKLKGNKSVFLGETKNSGERFQFRIPTNIRPSENYFFSLSGKGATGGMSDTVTISKSSKSANKAVVLAEPNDGVFEEGKKNVVRWYGGNKKVLVGVESAYGDVVGWIKTNAKPSGKVTWDGKKVCDLLKKTCWNLRDLTSATEFTIVVVSQNTLGNMVSDGEGNYDRSDRTIRIK